MQSRRGEERSEARQREGWPAPIREYSREPVLSKYTRRTNGEYTNRARACAGSGGRCGAFIVRPNEWMHTRYPGKLKHHLSNYNRRAIGLSFELFRIVPRSPPIPSRRVDEGEAGSVQISPGLDVQARRYIRRGRVWMDQECRNRFLLLPSTTCVRVALSMG